VAVSGAGAVAINTVSTRTNAHIDGTGSVTSAAGVTLKATSDAAVTASVVALSVALGGGATSAGLGIAIGVSVARNLIGSQLDGTFGPAEVQASIGNASVTATGAITADALARQTISAVVLAASAGIGASGTAGIAAAGSGVWTENRSPSTSVPSSPGTAPGGITASTLTLTATDASSIGVVAGAVALAAAFGGSAAVAFTVGVSLAHNDIASRVEAAIIGADTLVKTTTGAITLKATETAGIHAIAVAAAIAVGASGFGSVAISGAGAEASNGIFTKVNAYFDGSIVDAKTGIVLEARNTASIKAIVAALSVSVAVSGGVAAGIGIGAALAHNTIGNATTATHTSDQVLAGGIAQNATVRIASGARQGDVYRYVATTTARASTCARRTSTT
jgi:hypothetical protein